MPHAGGGSGGGDGQPVCAQGREGQGADRRQGLRALIYLPSYSPDFNPIEQAFSKLKGFLREACARSHQTLMEGIGEALRTISTSDAESFFDHCGYTGQ